MNLLLVLVLSATAFAQEAELKAPAPKSRGAMDYRSGDLQFAFGFAQATPTVLRTGVVVDPSQTFYGQMFGTLANIGFAGLDLEVGTGSTAHKLKDANTAVNFNTTAIDAGLGLRIQILGTGSAKDAFGLAVIAGGGASWPLSRSCSTSTGGECPYVDAVPNAIPYARATLESRFRGGYGLRLSADHKPKAVWPQTLGASTTVMATFMFNPTEMFSDVE